MASAASRVNTCGVEYLNVYCRAFCSSSYFPFCFLCSLHLTGGVVTELTRGVRLYFHKFVHGLSALSVAKAQLGLGHSYSRAKVKFNIHRSDNMIIQSIALLDQLDKDINTFAMRIRCVCVCNCYFAMFVCVHACSACWKEQVQDGWE